MKKITVQKIAQLQGHKASIYALAQAQAPHLFLSGAGEGWIVQWDLTQPKDGNLLAKVEGNIFSLLHLPLQNCVLAGNMYGGLHWVDLDKPDNTKNIAIHKDGIFGIHHIGKHVYTLGGRGLLTKWNIETRRSIESLHLSHQSLRSLAFAENRNQVAIGASDHHIYFVDLDKMVVTNTIKKAHDNSVFALQYSPDQKHLLSAGRDAHLKVWNIDNQNQLLSSQSAHWFTINKIAFHPKGHIFATASRDKTIRIWDSQSLQLLKEIDAARNGGHINSVNNLLWSSYNNYLISASDDRSLIVWDIY